MPTLNLADLDATSGQVREALLPGGSVTTHVASANPHPALDSRYVLASAVLPGSEVVPAVEVASFPGGTPLSFSGVTDLPGLTLTLPDISRPIWVRLFLPQVWSTVANGTAIAFITTTGNTSWNSASGYSSIANAPFSLTVWARIPPHQPLALKGRINGSGVTGGVNASPGLFVPSLAAFAA